MRHYYCASLPLTQIAEHGPIDFSVAIEMETRTEVYTAFEKLGADKQLLATIGSWGDTLEESGVLEL